MRVMLLSLLAAGAVAASAGPGLAQGTGCQLSLPARAETQTFAEAGHDASPARTSALAEATGRAFAAAASRLCASGVVTRAQLAPFTFLLVRNAEGADEPGVYDDMEQNPGALIVEYAFADGGAPPQAAIEAGIRCWRDPEREGCFDEVSP